MASSQAMLVKLIMIVVVLVMILSSAVAAPPTIADLKKLGCTDLCGNVSIPYPFGLKENCYLEEGFLVTCNQSKPYIGKTNITISDIFLEEGELRIMQSISRDCYDQLATPLQSNIKTLLELPEIRRLLAAREVDFALLQETKWAEKSGCQEAGNKPAMASSQAMLVKLIMIVVVLVMILSSAVAAPPTIADLKKLGCTDLCGNVSIPYPFGLKENCYLEEGFLVTCNQSKPYIGKTNITISDIFLEEGELRIMQSISRDCYDQLGTPLQSNINTSLELPKFTISNTKNKFTAIGCDTSASIQVSGVAHNYFITTGCLSACSTRGYIPDGNCSGIGCCQTSLPNGGAYADISLASFTAHRKVFDFNPCSYAFVVEDGAFNFSRSYLGNFSEEYMPMVLDWTIRSNIFTCEEAKRNQMSYECGQNSDCYKPDHGPSTSGYICKCLPGYQGNSYLLDGCQGFAVGGMVVLASSSWLYWIFRKRKLIKLREQFFRQNGGLMLQQQLSRQDKPTQELIKIFTSEELKQATNNYDESRIAGRGGFGIVYKGILPENKIVAIKKSQMVDESQIEQFINEVVVLSQINHRNVVKLLGCCLETQVPLLVYEFITNGTLFEHIHNQSKASNISWENRLRIAAETAGVLSYLHSAASIPIIHRDVKSTNILLDDNYTAKVSDFGASRLVPLDQNQLATVVQGTLGYLDPEYMLTSQLTEKSDVYSFGVVLVELITGKKALSFNRPEEERNLAMYFITCMNNDCLNQIIDEHMVIEGNTEELKEVANLAKRCLRVKGEERPYMKEVAMELEGLIRKKISKNGLNYAETENMLGNASIGYVVGGCGSNTTAVGVDSMVEDMLLHGGSLPTSFPTLAAASPLSHFTTAPPIPDRRNFLLRLILGTPPISLRASLSLLKLDFEEDDDTFLEHMGMNSHIGKGINCSNSSSQQSPKSSTKKNANKKRPGSNDDVVERLSMIANKL
ncbi:hypothetical protein TEA_011712 [Camellia sinensis var. sinensis]|uniref:Protein kinase domain-containing protein n=1 Tax=Camellia sinensis var. sinensis TaxID=542762 RepID=A0A4S4CW70_CAMSN|nr:hypothetical protein TEA_011712 [Camellia sinensis var. sinensis]